MRILTLLPRSWSIKKAANVFGVSKYLIRQAKKPVAEKDIMSSPNPKCGRTLPAHIEKETKHFYLSDEISRVMTGKKDFILLSRFKEESECMSRRGFFYATLGKLIEKLSNATLT